MAPFTAKYTPEQRDALAHAYEDRQIHPAQRVVDMAKAGELVHDGEKLAPFEPTADTVRDLARHLRKRRAGKVTSKLADAAPRDAIEQLRRRLVNVCDTMLADVEKAKPGTIDPERVRQIARATRETAALPGPNDPRPKPPGSKQGGTREGGETKGGLAGEIMKDHKAVTEGTAPSPLTTNNADHDQTSQHNDNASATHAINGATTDENDDSPGSLVRELAAAAQVQL